MTFAKGFEGEDFSVFAEPAERPTKLLARATILLVDDDPDVLNAMRIVLSDHYILRAARSGADALRLIDNEVSAAVLDVKMANMDGFETCEAIRRQREHLPIIFHSAYQDRRDLYAVLNQLHPFAFLTKGEPASVILKTVADAVASQRYRQELSTVRNELAELKHRLGKVAANKPGASHG